MLPTFSVAQIVQGVKAQSVKELGRLSDIVWLRYRSFNLDMPWDMLHRQAAVRATSRNAVAVTGASNERGRRVLYVFYAV